MKIKVIDPQCEPFRKHATDAGIDLRVSMEGSRVLHTKAKTKIDTGIQVAIPPNYCGLVVPRSSLGVEYGLELVNTIGVIDSDYRGNIFVNIKVTKALKLEGGLRFAQLVIVPVLLDYDIVDDLEETERGDGGFGSTDEEDITSSVTGD